MPAASTKNQRIDGDTRFLYPEVVARIGNLEMVARLIVEGFMIGLHKSPYHGFSSEFASYRKYVKGDPFRFIDWKVYGRTDRFYIKRFEENTNTCGYILLDVSASMNFGQSTIDKFMYARCLTAAFAYLMLKQGDSAGLVTFGSREVSSLPARGGFLHLQQILAKLGEARPELGTDLRSGLGRVPDRIFRRGMILLISDLLADPEEILDVVKGFRYRKHEVVIFHLLTPEEREFPYRDNMEFVDAESGEKITAQGSYIREGYRRALERHVERLKHECRDMDADFVELGTNTLLSNAILAYLARRQLMM